MHLGRHSVPAKAASVALSFLSLLGAARALGAEAARGLSPARVTAAERHDTSPPLWLMPRADEPAAREWEHRQVRVPRHPTPATAAPERLAPARLAASPSREMPAQITAFNGVGGGFAGPGGTFDVDSMPPDTEGDVGPNHYVQVVNASFAVFNKSGTVLYGPAFTRTLWSGFGGVCETTNQGDGVVLYDPLADRWFISQFAFALDTNDNPIPPYMQCIAVSRTADPTGAFDRYAFRYTDSADYGKFGVWPDGYYATFNTFSDTTGDFAGALACAYDRAQMLQGAPATQQCVNLGIDIGGVLPTDFDGTRLPPAGSPNYIAGFDTAPASHLQLWRFHVDWVNPANTTVQRQPDLPVNTFYVNCALTSCVPQPGTSTVLDALDDRLMYRLAYRNFGTHESLVLNHSVGTSASTLTGLGIRWYELRDPNGTPTVFQQGTYAPDNNYRWLGSLAQDQLGDMALGFSMSNASTIKPGIYYTGRLVTDPAGTMPQGESALQVGSGAQTTVDRWGDYSMMAVDPADDCTFWFTSEYIPALGNFNWRTRVASFKFPGCPGVADDFSLAASPRLVRLPVGTSASYTITTAVTAGTAQSLTLSATNLPPGVTAAFNPSTVTAGGSSTLTLTADANAPHVELAPFNIVGASASATRLAVTSVAVLHDFTLAVGPTTATISPSKSTLLTVTTTNGSGTPETITFSASNLPAGVTATFSPAQVTAGGSATLTLSGSAQLTGQPAQSVIITGTTPNVVRRAPITVNTLQSPTAAITSPMVGKVKGTVTVVVTGAASSGTTLTSLELYLDDTLLGSGATSPYRFTWDTTKVMNGPHALHAKAYDAAGNVGQANLAVTVSNIAPPTVTITAPASGASVNGKYTLVAAPVAGAGATIATVDFYVDDVLIGSADTEPREFVWDTTTAKEGEHVLVVKAYDSEAQVGVSDPLTFKVRNTLCGCDSGSGAAGSGGLVAILLGLMRRRRR